MACGSLMLFYKNYTVYQQINMPILSDKDFYHSTSFVCLLSPVHDLKQNNNNKNEKKAFTILMTIPVSDFGRFSGPSYFDHRYIPFREDGFQIEPQKHG